MPNIGGPKQCRRKLLSSVVTSVLTYGISIWADALGIQESHRRVASVYRLSALRVASAFRTVSEDAVCVIAGMLPIKVLAVERQALYRRKRLAELTTEKLRTEERQNCIRRWQVLWKAATNGRWTYRLIPHVDVWLSRKHGEVNYYLTQMLSGHGCFRAYLHRFRQKHRSARPALEPAKMRSTYSLRAPVLTHSGILWKPPSNNRFDQKH